MINDFINASWGGALIGLSAVGLLFTLGRIAGISGIVWQALKNNPLTSSSEGLWRWMFLLGLIAGPALIHTLFSWPIPEKVNAPIYVILSAGFLVGMGVKLGSGCTSGHGICGISRFSVRSLTATLVFMGSGIATVFIVRHILS